MPTILERYKKHQENQKVYPDWFRDAYEAVEHTFGNPFEFRVIDPLSQEGQDAIEAVDDLQPICRNCKFWRDISIDHEFGKCDKEVVERQIATRKKTERAFHKDFGCIHFEAKDV